MYDYIDIFQKSQMGEYANTDTYGCKWRKKKIEYTLYIGAELQSWWTDCNVVVNEYELMICNYIHFRSNTIEKVRNPLNEQLWV